MPEMNPKAKNIYDQRDRKWLAERVVQLEADNDWLQLRYQEQCTRTVELNKKNVQLKVDRAALADALEHCGYDPEDCIDCGGPPHNEHCRFWKLRHILSYWKE